MKIAQLSSTVLFFIPLATSQLNESQESNNWVIDESHPAPTFSEELSQDSESYDEALAWELDPAYYINDDAAPVAHTSLRH